MKLNWEKIQRRIGDGILGGKQVGGGGGGSLAGYATESWVDENYLSIEFFNRIFTIHGTDNNTDVDVEPNDLDTTITSIEAMFGFWTEYYVSALGNGGDLGSTLYLSSLADVALTSPISDGQVLQYNLSTGKWTNGTITGNFLPLTGGTMSGGISFEDANNYSTTRSEIVCYDGTLQANVRNSIFCISKMGVSGLNIDISSINRGTVVCYAPTAGGTLLTSGNTKTINGQSIFGTGDIVIGGGSGNYLPLAGGLMSGTIKFQNINSYQTTYNEITVYDNILHMNCRSNKFVISKMGVNGWIFDMSLLSSGTRTIQLGGDINPIANNTYTIGGLGSEYAFTDSRVVFARHVNGSRTFAQSYNADLYLNYSGDVMPAGDTFINPNNSGRVGIGTISPSYKLHVSGDIYATGAVTALSDVRKKDERGMIGLSVEQIAGAPAVQFTWKGERAKEGLQVGTYAQYWHPVLPEVVMDRGGELSMQYGVAALVSAIITARKVVDHERRITELERENERLRTEIEQLRLN